MNTIDVLSLIADRNRDILGFYYHFFPKQVLIQDVITEWGEKESAHFKQAIEIRDKLHLPFWDSIMVSTFDNINYSDKIIERALYHNHITQLLYINSGDLYKLNNDTFMRKAVNSAVKMVNGDIMHLPMLDFHIPVSQINYGIVKKVCRALNLNEGFILNSGESYHYISSMPTSWDNLYLILVKALQFCPIIDRAWISHQLIEKSCSLRIDKKNGVNTIVIEGL
jgi:hypothetical protein